MNKSNRNSLIATLSAVLIGFLFAWAGSQGGVPGPGIPLFALLVGLAFLIQWLAFIPAYRLQTEKFFDLTGSLAYLSVILIAALFSPDLDARSVLLLTLVAIWAIRLGSFLFLRIQKAGRDSRFDDIKPSFIRFLNIWTMQGLWVTLTVGAALAAVTTTIRKEFDFPAIIGLCLWIGGFTMEAVADAQKRQFIANAQNRGRFIQTGLWSKSRHPNYFGEIVVWIGIAMIAMPVLHGWRLVTLISPVFVTFLLTKVSGIPILEKKADEKWGGQEDYQAYKKRTPVLIPRLIL
jgi:steroid 5-alpha reductase family enzyme